MEFPSTMWTEIAAASLHGNTKATQALGEFYVKYLGPVRRYMALRGSPESQIDDLVQEFFLELMKDSSLRHADRARGRFRSFLLGAVSRFLHDVRVRRQALKRGSGVEPTSIDDGDVEGVPVSPRADDTEFDRLWALGIVEAVYKRLEAEFAGRGRTHVFEVLRRFLPGGGSPTSYQEAAAALGFSESSIKVEIHRMRSRFRDTMREEVLTTLARPHEIDDEMRYLAQVLRST